MELKKEIKRRSRIDKLLKEYYNALSDEEVRFIESELKKLL